jgi:sec-independent protein translocase protein TatA
MHPTWTLLIVLALAFLLFAKPGKLSGLMEDLGKGIRGFRKGMTDQDNQPQPPAEAPPRPEAPRQVSDQTTTTTNTTDRTPS